MAAAAAAASAPAPAPADTPVPLPTPPPAAVRRIVVDTDAGIDDAMALMLALRAPAVEVVALTCTHGNVALEHVVGNVCAVAEAAGAPATLPIYAGADRPLVVPLDKDASEWHGADGLGNTGRGAAAPRGRVVAGTHAAVALASIAAAAAAEGRPVDIVALGPLTNLALAVRLTPTLADSAGTVYIMGGAHAGSGNMTLTAEYNVGMDAEAAAIVFAAFPRIVMVSWELTLKYPARRDWLEACYLHGRTPASAFLAAVGRHLIAATGEADYNATGLLIPDPLAVAVAVAPRVVTASRTAAVHVELGGSHARGMTVCDWRPTKAPANVTVVDAVDFDAVCAALSDSVRP